MAGIAGSTGTDRVDFTECLLAKIDHRGGAGRLVCSFDGGTLGQAWPAAQKTFACGLGEHAVVLDGEIHNWMDLTVGATCPLEALETAYRDEGPDFVKELDGPFALSIATPKGIFLARDRVGKSPLYYARSNGTVSFASELKGLSNVDGEVSEFPPGHYYDPEIGLRRHAIIDKRPVFDRPEDQVAEELRGLLVDSVAKRIGDGEVGAWLSGGIDSASLTALARRQLPKLQTFVAGVEGARDLEYARMVSEYVGTEHHERICTVEEMLAALPEVIYHLESFDALLVRSSVTNFMVGQLASDHVEAVLSGEGGDELFGGYAYLQDLEPEELPEELVDITRRLHNTALQRVDRCSAGHGLVARTAFLDRDVLDYALRIPPEMKIQVNGSVVEKWILRRALDGLLPDEVLTRTKSKFWEGAGVDDLLEAHAKQAVSDAEFGSERMLDDGAILNTKEELFYYRLFRDAFGDSVDPDLVGRTEGAPVAN
jgi:asparagine synthase (glutamine-hydrolysing)